MSRFLSSRLASLEPYAPGEQPRDRRYIKLNTNESPYPPSEAVQRAVAEQSSQLMLYSDPEAKELTAEFCKLFGVTPDSVIFTNGSDEALDFAFYAFSDSTRPMVFPDLTYGFYSVFADLYGIPYTEIPLKPDFSISVEDYVGVGKNVVIANPNAPTALALPLSEVERIVASNPDNVVVIDEAYVDFGGESAMPLIKKYKNLIVTGTFSKSRSLAGARLGFAVADPALIADMNTVKFSRNPYNVNRMTAAAGAAALRDNCYYMDNCKRIIETRDYARAELLKMGFEVTDSRTNFLFCQSPDVDGETLYSELRRRGILVRHFGKERIKNFNRITVGTREETESLLSAIRDILDERKK